MGKLDKYTATELDSLPKWLRHNAAKYGNNKVAMYYKHKGIWKSYTWQDCYQHCKYFGLGLLKLGLNRGDKVAVIGDNDPNWYWAEYAVQAIGGIILGIFVDALPAEAKFIIENSESTYIIAKDQEQVDKVLNFAHQLPQVNKIVYWEHIGMWNYEDPLLISWEEVEELGKQSEQANPDLFETNIDMANENDYAAFLYTSGTGGLPKGAIHTHKTIIACGKSVQSIFPWSNTDNYVSAYSPGYIAEQMIGVSGGLMVAAHINFPEKPDTLNENIREVAPEFLMFTGRMWESLASMVISGMLNTTKLKKVFYDFALPIGYKKADLELMGKKPNLLLRILYLIAHSVVFHQIKDRLGLVHLRYGVSAGAPLSPDCLRFFRAIGVPMGQALGFSELIAASGHLIGDPPDSETLGRVAPMCEVRITDTNEILVRSDGLFIGYYKDPEATNKARGDGWFHSGDAGTVNERGQLVFWDRVTDLLEIRGGFKFPPQYIEGKLKFSPYILDVMVIGGSDRDFVAAIITIDFDVCCSWAETHRIAYTTFNELSQKQQIIDLVSNDIKRVNRVLSIEQRVKRFINLNKSFDADDAELTRTRKLRRKYIVEKYSKIIDAIYSSQGEYVMDTSVTYADGSNKEVRTNIKITDVD